MTGGMRGFAGCCNLPVNVAALPAPPPGTGTWPLVVVGAGAAGLLAGIFAGRAGCPVLVLETRPVPGAKIRVSGGGRCNVLPSEVVVDDFHTEGSRNALRNALFAWPLKEVRAFFEDELGIPLKVEATGKVFPVSDDPREIVAALLNELECAGAVLAGSARIVRLEREEGAFVLATEEGDVLRAERVVLATGGLSLPKTGSDGGGLELARALGHQLVPTYPALVPLATDDAGWGELAGVSQRARLRAMRGERVLLEREGDLLFTHRGFSGPVALDVSYQLAAPWAGSARLEAHWVVEEGPDWDALLRAGGVRSVASVLRAPLPKRLATRLIELSGVDGERKLSQLTRDERQRLIGVLEHCPLAVVGNEGYRTAEVTGGGVPLGELVTRTLESRVVPGLYFAGEIVDVTGRIGGYNFLWAWVSGRTAGRAAAAGYSSPSASLSM
jgi:predicted Rossmann fold flavoprotein